MGITFVACQTEIEFSGKETAPLLVVNSILTPDSIIQVRVTESKFFLEDDSRFNEVKNATVKIWVNDTEIPVLTHEGNGLYVSSYRPKAGDKIKITAKNDKYAEVHSYTEIQQSIPVTAVDTTYKITDKYPIVNYNNAVMDTIGYNYNVKLDMKFHFKDPQEVENFYRIKLTVVDYLANGIRVNNYQYFGSDDPVFKTTSEEGIFGELDGGSYRQNYIFSDALFNGKEYGLKVFTDFFTYNYTESTSPKDEDPNNPNKLVKKELVLELQSISKSYYLYLKTLEASNGNDIGLFSEPVQIHNNIVGGIGLFGSYNTNFFHFEVRKDIGNNYYY